MAEEEKITLAAALAALEKKFCAWPRTRPLSDAEMNERARMLEKQKKMLLTTEGAKDAEKQTLAE